MLRLTAAALTASVLIASGGLSGCSLIYKLPTRQGNVIEQKQLDQLKLGMTRDQVKFLLGTPIAASPYTPDRWDYFGYYKSPRGKVASRTVTLYFQGDKLSQMQGIQLASNDAKLLDNPDFETLKKEEKKDANDKSRAEGAGGGKDPGINIPTPTP